ncbi:MAG: site-specific DNA-methyltransferase [Candidatus Acidiferrales bacterium]
MSKPAKISAAVISAASVASALPDPVFKDSKHHIRIYQGDCLEILAAIPEGVVDLIFADPPYFLSNNGITCHAGKMVSVNKGEWDRSRGADANHEFNRAWLAACQRVLKPNGTIWVSGTSHVIHSVGFAMQQLDFTLLNDISWVKPNPPPNLSCRYFTHATETIIWAAKNKKSQHVFNYKMMKENPGGMGAPAGVGFRAWVGRLRACQDAGEAANEGNVTEGATGRNNVKALGMFLRE